MTVRLIYFFILSRDVALIRNIGFDYHRKFPFLETRCGIINIFTLTSSGWGQPLCPGLAPGGEAPFFVPLPTQQYPQPHSLCCIHALGALHAVCLLSAIPQTPHQNLEQSYYRSPYISFYLFLAGTEKYPNFFFIYILPINWEKNNKKNFMFSI